jgi:hydrophobic/amphiphilic exporter-1 (mainly G- bacteria), HAE1 family
MSIWEICVRRPVFTIMLVTAPVVLGLASYGRLGVELYPNVDLPTVVVTTTLRGASVEEMESAVTKKIEEAVNTVSGIDELRSTTKEGFTQVIIQFVLAKNGATAAQEVDAKVRGILSQLPVGTDPPIIDRFDLDAMPVVTIVVSGSRDIREVSEIARKRLKEDLETLPGVGSCVLVGGRQRAIQIIIDPEKLLKYENLTVEDVRQALIRENQEQPGGRIDRGQSEIVLRTMGRIQKPEDFTKLIIANRNGQPIRIEDIGRVEDLFEEPRNLSRLWIPNEEKSNLESPGQNAISLIVQKQSGENTVAVVNTVMKRLEKLKPLLPDDIRIETIRNQSRFIVRSIDEVKWHLILAIGLVSATVMLFMGDWRTTIIASLAIPTSIVGTFAFMDAMGLTLNNISMLGLILAVGIVIDDAVVVNENIYRYMSEFKMSAWDASIKATKEISLAVLATTLSLMVIFAPIAFMGGTVGRFFNCFGFVVAFSVFISMVISFTLTPMLCSRFLKPGAGHGDGGWVWRQISNFYLAILGWSLRHRWVILLASVGVFFSTPVLFGIVGKNFITNDDQSEFEVSITLPEGYTLERADETLQEMDRKLRKLRGVTYTYTTIGDTTGKVTRGQGDVTKATIYCRLTELEERTFSQFEVMREARKITAQYPDLRTAVINVSLFNSAGFREVDVDLNLIGPDTTKLKQWSDRINQFMSEKGGYIDVDTSLSLAKPEARIRPDRERFSDLGVSIDDVARTTNILVGGEPVSKYKEEAEQYDVWLRAEPKYRNDWEVISRMSVPSKRDPSGVVRLGNLTTVEYSFGPNSIERFNRQRQLVISCNLDGKDMGSAIVELREFLLSIQDDPKLALTPEYSFAFIGRAKTQQESNDNFAIAFLLAFIFMYMILASQFESFVHPLTIMAALPLTLPFAIASLILVGANLDIFAMFGLFMLFGIVKKNGILQIDATNQLKAQGLPRDEAILEANRRRLRPILMTTVMLVAAMIPLAMGEGPGSSARAGMGKVILGGQALSLLLTLLLTPVAYSMWESLIGWWDGSKQVMTSDESPTK